MAGSKADHTKRIEALHKYLRLGFKPVTIPCRPGETSALEMAANEIGITATAFRSSLKTAVRDGMTVDWSLYTPRAEEPGEQTQAKEINVSDKVRERLRRGSARLEDLRAITGLGESATLGILEDLQAGGFNVHRFGDVWSIEKAPPLPRSPIENVDDIPTLISRPDNTFLVGATGDQHLCSKYHRPDVLNDLYDRFERAQVQCVYNTGNWIDGEARFNKHDLLVHGMEAQCRYLAKNYPRRAGIKTYAVAGDDHEGWYGQREGVDIGRFAERIMREEGRDDWVHLGYMEAFVRLVNANTGKSSMLAVVHPGGGSAYALSYSIQKIIEVLDGGEKPAVGFYGHYHKLWAGNIRNVWCLQTGTCEDQTPFMRKQKIDAHVGGCLVEMEQDPETGAIIGFTPKLIRYFNKGYYNQRWSHGGDVNLPERRP